MPRPPFEFGIPEIVLKATGFWLGKVIDPGGQGYQGFYLGELLASAILYSRYTLGLPTSIPIDSLSPEAYSFFNKNLTISQDTTVVPAGRNTVTLNFIKPIHNELAQEFLITKGPVSTGPEPASTSFAELAAGTFTVFAGGFSLGAPGGSSVVPTAPSYGARFVTVADITSFAAGQWVKIENTIGGEITVVRIASISILDITFESDILMIMEDAATIETINDPVVITEVTDYTIVISTGSLSILETAATIDKLIWIEYKSILFDYDGGDFWIIPGTFPVPDRSDPALVSGFPGAISLGSVNAAATSFAFERDGAELGNDFTLYAIAKDDEFPPNPSLARATDFTQIPGRPTTISSTVSPGVVNVTWNNVPDTDGSETTGYNLVRNQGISLIPSLAERVNDELITPTSPTVTFVDESGGVNINPLISPPVGGVDYVYAVESGKVTGKYSILTENELLGVLPTFVAEKQLSD